jgi:poly-gamma-glutamate capsule biosynthesis protein CapA/YwtB (metallophosphatase superfamily)
MTAEPIPRGIAAVVDVTHSPVRHTVRAAPAVASALVDAGLNVVSFTGSHCLDFGYTDLADTVACLTEAGARAAGVGSDIGRSDRPRTRCRCLGG